MTRSVAIIGAGIGGLACAALLAASGCAVTLFDPASRPGGKLRQLSVAGRLIDSGPTVLTMRFVFEQIFADCGARLDTEVSLAPLEILARHAWQDGSQLDLFADRARSAEAIGAFAGAAEARGYLDFCARAARSYAALEHSFIRAARPTPVSLARRTGLAGLTRISPFSTLWGALGDHFRDPRLRQLFGRYATYCGASPYLAPATLMLVAHVEQEGVWSVAGGIHALAAALAALATRHGAVLHPGTTVQEILCAAGRVSGVRLASGEQITADAVVLNADHAALAAGLFGDAVRRAVPVTSDQRSLSALTWSIAGRPHGFPLLRHNVFFSTDYAAEFDDVFTRRRLPTHPTLYLCAADRLDTPVPASTPERLFCIMNAPATGDTDTLTAAQIDAATTEMHRLFRACGLELECDAMTLTTPTDFAHRFPATGGALYGPATHGPMASFRRPGARTKVPGLYLAGGSVHPGPGVPMAALSGRQAAISVLADGDSTSRSRRTAIAGGMSTG